MKKRIPIIIGVIAISVLIYINFAKSVSLTTTNYIKSAQRSGMFAYYNMNDNDINGTTVYEKSGNAYNGTLANTPTTGETGILKQAIAFDGVNQYIDLPDAVGTKIPATNEFGVTGWFKITSFDNNAGIVGLGSSTDRQLWVYTTSGNAVTFISNTDGSNVLISLNTLSTDTWYFFAFTGSTADGNATAYIYDSNGVLQDSVTDSSYSGNIVAGTSDNFIGNINGFDYANGTLDEIRIYDERLSLAEIQANLEATKINYIHSASRSGLIGYWTMDSNDVNGTTWYDKSGNGYDLTATNAPVNVPGKIKQAVNFVDASAQYLDNSDNPFSGDVDMSMSLWARYSTLPNTTNNGVNAIGDLAGDITGFYVLTSNNGFRGLLDGNILNADQTLAPNTWYNMVLTYNSTTKDRRVYLDGVKVYDVSGAVSFNGSTIQVGRIRANNNQDWDGDVDEVRLYNRVLSQTDVTNLYNATRVNYKL